MSLPENNILDLRGKAIDNKEVNSIIMEYSGTRNIIQLFNRFKKQGSHSKTYFAVLNILFNIQESLKPWGFLIGQSLPPLFSIKPVFKKNLKRHDRS